MCVYTYSSVYMYNNDNIIILAINNNENNKPSKITYEPYNGSCLPCMLWIWCKPPMSFA